MAPAVKAGANRYSAGFLDAVDHALMVLEKDRPQSVEEWRKELDPLGAPRSPIVPPASAETGKTGRIDWLEIRTPRPFHGWLWLLECGLVVLAVLTRPVPLLSEAFTSPDPAAPFSFFEGIFAPIHFRLLWLAAVMALALLLGRMVMLPLSARIESTLLRALLGLILFNGVLAGVFVGGAFLFQALDPSVALW